MTTPRGGVELMARLRELARFSAEPDAMTRLYLTPEHKQAAAQVEAWMREAGMSVHVDAVGTWSAATKARPRTRRPCCWARISTPCATPASTTASSACWRHQAVRRAERGRRAPAVRDRGAGLRRRGGRALPRTLHGSRAVAGTLRSGVARRHGRRWHHDPRGAARVRLRPRADRRRRPRSGEVLGYVEVHIEQGPVLEARTCRSAWSRPSTARAASPSKVRAMAGHAGTVPMDAAPRRLAAAAEMVLEVERRRGRSRSRRHRGRLKFQPGAVNVIPGRGRFLLDCRAGGRRARRRHRHSLARVRGDREARRGVTVTSRLLRAAARPARPDRQALRPPSPRGMRPLRLPSGAGHDGLAMVAPARSACCSCAARAASATTPPNPSPRGHPASPSMSSSTSSPAAADQPSDDALLQERHDDRSVRRRSRLPRRRAWPQEAFLAELVKVQSANPPGDCDRRTPSAPRSCSKTSASRSSGTWFRRRWSRRTA